MKAIIVTQFMALSGVKEIIRIKRSEINGKYPGRVINKAMPDISFEKDISDLLTDESVTYAKPLGEGGFFAGLWYMAKDLKSGFSVNMETVPIIQETIEICEMFGINPYILESKGAWLVVSCEPERQVEAFRKNDIPAVIIGAVEDSNDKKILIGERVRFLDRPAPDELRKFL